MLAMKYERESCVIAYVGRNHPIGVLIRTARDLWAYIDVAMLLKVTSKARMQMMRSPPASIKSLRYGILSEG